jgi:hypothetical protein
VLYQLSYIGPKLSCQPLAFSHQQIQTAECLLRDVVVAVGFPDIFAMQPRLHGKQGQDRKSHHANPFVGNCGVRQQSKNDERRKRNYQTIHSIPRIMPLGIFSPRISHRK